MLDFSRLCMYLFDYLYACSFTAVFFSISLLVGCLFVLLQFYFSSKIINSILSLHSRKSLAVQESFDAGKIHIPVRRWPRICRKYGFETPFLRPQIHTHKHLYILYLDRWPVGSVFISLASKCPLFYVNILIIFNYLKCIDDVQDWRRFETGSTHPTNHNADG